MKSIILLTTFMCLAFANASNFQHSEVEISEVLQTNLAFDYILDYEVPLYIETIEDEVQGSIEIYKLSYIIIENESKCEYVTFDPEINHLELTNVKCDQPVDDVISENLREID